MNWRVLHLTVAASTLVVACDASDREPAPDAAPSSCKGNAISTVPCGHNLRGAAPARCIDGEWQATGACDEPDICRDDDERGLPCGWNGHGTIPQTCIEGVWVDDTDVCIDDDVCADGVEQSRPCGLNGRGRVIRQCVDGDWEVSPVCDDRDVCIDATMDLMLCDGGFIQERQCHGGVWGSWGPCPAPGACVEGQRQEAPCGPNLRGVRVRRCIDGVWDLASACRGAGVCVDGMVSRQPCGLNGNGYREVVCIAGAWSAHPDFGERCQDPDTCRIGAVEVNDCRSGYTRTRRCQGGFWARWARCRPRARCLDASECDDGQECTSQGACITPTCHDGRRNGEEAGVDCGGDCPDCIGELCNWLDDDADGEVDEDYDVGRRCIEGEGACRAEGIRSCATDGVSTRCSVQRGVGADEICDGIDNDCDGTVDESADAWCTTELRNVSKARCVARPAVTACIVEACRPGWHNADGLDRTGCEAAACDAGAVGPDAAERVGGICRRPLSDGEPGCACAGVWQCVPDTSAPSGFGIACDVGSGVEPGDGAITTSMCPAGQWVGGFSERCNDIDDDCDGAVDEGFDIGSACHLGEGPCRRRGFLTCREDGGVECDADAPPVEVCDGLDDDCDGIIDEDTGAACIAAMGPGVHAAACLDGRCTIAICAEGTADHDRWAENGCEGAACAHPDAGDFCEIEMYPDGDSMCRCVGVLHCAAGGGVECRPAVAGEARALARSCEVRLGGSDEICGSGADEDCDGRVDCEDGDCADDPVCDCREDLDCPLDETCTGQDEDGSGVCVPAGCGDGLRQGDGPGRGLEACDDGDNEDGDGCSARCQVEEGFDCIEAGIEPIRFEVDGVENCGMPPPTPVELDVPPWPAYRLFYVAGAVRSAPGIQTGDAAVWVGDAPLVVLPASARGTPPTVEDAEALYAGLRTEAFSVPEGAPVIGGLPDGICADNAGAITAEIRAVDACFTTRCVSGDDCLLGTVCLGGVCAPLVDSDGDGVSDDRDIDDDNDGIPDGIECSTRVGGWSLLANGGFELPGVPVWTTRLAHPDNVPGWSTTAADGTIELWGDHFAGVPSAEGVTFARLGDNLGDALYQDIATVSGTTFDIRFYHRMRGAMPARVELRIGPPGETAQVLTAASDEDAWSEYIGSYTVPAGQALTRFELVNAEPGNSVNLLDGVEFIPRCDHRADADGDGLPNRLDLDSDGDGVPDAVEAGHGLPNTDGVVDGEVSDNGLVDGAEEPRDSGSINYDLRDANESDLPDFLEAGA